MELMHNRLQNLPDRFEGESPNLTGCWVNIATTAVISHYNAAVELEFLKRWKEAGE